MTNFRNSLNQLAYWCWQITRIDRVRQTQTDKQMRNHENQNPLKEDSMINMKHIRNVMLLVLLTGITIALGVAAQQQPNVEITSAPGRILVRFAQGNATYAYDIFETKLRNCEPGKCAAFEIVWRRDGASLSRLLIRLDPDEMSSHLAEFQSGSSIIIWEGCSPPGIFRDCPPLRLPTNCVNPPCPGEPGPFDLVYTVQAGRLSLATLVDSRKPEELVDFQRRFQDAFNLGNKVEQLLPFAILNNAVFNNQAVKADFRRALETSGLKNSFADKIPKEAVDKAARWGAVATSACALAALASAGVGGVVCAFALGWNISVAALS